VFRTDVAGHPRRFLSILFSVIFTSLLYRMFERRERSHLASLKINEQLLQATLPEFIEHSGKKTLLGTSVAAFVKYEFAE
jgi:hypothetical protein